MTAAAIVVAALIAVAAVLFVARPLLRSSSAPDDGLPDVDPHELEHVRLAEERDRALSALKELEFDHRTGKITDADYRQLVGPLRREAADALRALDASADEEQEPDA